MKAEAAMVFRIEMVGNEQQYFDDCACCGREFRRGPGRHDGAEVAVWKVAVCHWCLPPFRVPAEVAPTDRLLAALKANGVAARRNGNGLLEVPFLR
jgi:hypothetical protein